MRTFTKWAVAAVGATVTGLLVIRRRALARNAAAFDQRHS